MSAADRFHRLGISALALLVAGSLLVAARPSTASAKEESATVVLLHGLGRSAANMRILEWRLRARGHRVCNVGYDTRVATIDDAVIEVAEKIDECEVGEGAVHFVTHSLGGLVLRALLATNPPPRAGRAVMLAPPNQGSEIADRLSSLGWLKPVMGPLSIQLGTADSDLPRQLPTPSIPFGVIAGNEWINPAGPLWLPAPHDGTVSVASTRLDGMSDHIVLPYTHTFIVNAGVVADQVDAFLRQERFDPVD
jgi:pimeloyl-ACP methyl ester carboxylesterase